jgi:hypothetical protein
VSNLVLVGLIYVCPSSTAIEWRHEATSLE